ncbi:cuticle protein AM1159-like [Palaemon carinicauda]|uniref:cuticle protein AM1159-like n=1 Tax=Palaemon carinicauda TaxID=392227 RepID=UPI0035B58334
MSQDISSQHIISFPMRGSTISKCFSSLASDVWEVGVGIKTGGILGNRPLPSESHSTHLSVPLKFVAALLVASVVADKVPLTNPRLATILKNEQHTPDEFGNHNSDFETENGIEVHISGSQGESGGANVIGSWSYVQDDGSLASLKFVADEFGYQPESDLLPVAPHFPHPIPQFVLDQIEFARLEDERRAREGVSAED